MYIFYCVNAVPNEALVNTMRPIADRINITYIIITIQVKMECVNHKILGCRNLLASHVTLFCITHKNTLCVTLP